MSSGVNRATDILIEFDPISNAAMTRNGVASLTLRPALYVSDVINKNFQQDSQMT